MAEDYTVQVSLKNRRGDMLNIRGGSVPEVQDHLASAFNDDAAREIIHSFLDGGSGWVKAEPDERQVAEKMAREFKGEVIDEIPNCPECGGPMWDNRPKKRSGEYGAKSPDFSCKDKECKNDKGYRSGVWLEKPRSSKRES